MNAWAPVMASTAVTVSLAVLLWKAFTAQLEVTMGSVIEKIDALDQRLNGRIDTLDQRLNGRIDALGERLTGRIDALDEKFEARFAAFDEKMDSRFETVNYRLSALEGDMTLVKQHLLSTAPQI